MKKKITLILATVCLIITPLSSTDYDWGGALQNTTGTDNTDGWSITQVDSISLWAEINANELFNLKAAGGYRLLYEDGVLSHIPEFSALYAYGGKDGVSYKAGRFNMSDSSKTLFSTIIDGFDLKIQTQKMLLGMGVGFTGIVFSDNSTVTMTAKDYEAIINDALFASPRLAEYAEASFFVLPGDGSLNVSFLAQQDLRAASSLVSQEGLLHSFYLNLGMKGRLASILYYNLYTIGEIGTYHMAADSRSLLLIAGAGGLELKIPFNSPIKPLLSFDLYFSSGDNWERTNHKGSFIDVGKTTLYQYTPFSGKSKGYVYNVSTGNLIYGDVSFSITPASFLSVSASSLTMFRPVDGPVSTLPVSEGDTGAFLGEEFTVAFNIKPLSDLGFQVKSGVFIPNSSVVANGVQFKVSGFMSLSF